MGGVLSEAALAFFWRNTKLATDHYSHAATMLCDAGVLFSLPPEPPSLLRAWLPRIFGGEEEKALTQYMMPMRLPEVRAPRPLLWARARARAHGHLADHVCVCTCT